MYDTMRIVFIGLAVALLCISFSHAQVPEQKPKFEVVSVKPTPPERQTHLQLDRCTSGGRFFIGGAPLMWTLTYAFGLKEYQVFGAPDWLNDFASAYDIEGKPAAPVNEEQCRLMVQSVFADRFKLVTHWETKEAAVYLLKVGTKGTKLREGGGVKLNGGVQMLASGKPQFPDGWEMNTLARVLSNYTDRPVVDRTGLSGTYGITLDFAIENGDDRPSVFTAVQEQLGLKLEAGKAPIEMLVIDHIEKANQN